MIKCEFFAYEVSSKELRDLKKTFLETYDGNRDGRIEIREVRTLTK
jgi:hypothetical protein